MLHFGLKRLKSSKNRNWVFLLTLMILICYLIVALITIYTGRNKDHQTVDSALVPKRSGQLGSLADINDPSQLRALCLADRLMVKPVRVNRIMRLVYTNSGGALLALTYNGVHKLWKWQKNDSNVAGKATSGVVPHLWMPSTGVIMTNHIMSANTEEPCLAISKNDSYVMSSSEGEISLFNMHTFEPVTKFMHPPPMATAVAIHPSDNNLLAIGMDDSRILLYNVQVHEVKGTLTGHTQRVTGLAFSNHPLVLVSSGADSQVMVSPLLSISFCNIPILYDAVLLSA